jgi:hypothetical protein
MHSALNGGSEIGMGGRVSCKDYKGPILWQTEPREGFPEGIPIRSLAPHNTLDLKDKQEGEGVEESRGPRKRKMASLTFPGHARHRIHLKCLKGLGEGSGVSLRL